MSDLINKLEDIEAKINSISERLQIVLSENVRLIKENSELKEKIGEIGKNAGMIRLAQDFSGQKNDPEETKKKINEFIKEIDKCIALLNN